MRIAMHKFWNFSQSGVANDPIYVHKSITEKFKTEFQRQIKLQYGVHTRTNMQVAPTMRYTRNIQALELNDIHSIDNRTLPPEGSDELSPSTRKKADIDVPLMQGEQASSLVAMIEYDTIETVISELRRTNVTGVHYYGATGSKSRKLLEERVRSAYFILNDSPLQQCNVFAPLKNAYACGLGKIRGLEGTSYPKSRFHEI